DAMDEIVIPGASVGGRLSKSGSESHLRVQSRLSGMMRIFYACGTACLLLSLASGTYAQNDMRYFITRSGDRLMEGDSEYRFISFNVPNLHLVEDDMRLGVASEWRFPDEFEITDALETVKQLGGRVARMYVISICSTSLDSAIPCHVTRPGVFNEEAFRALDKVLEIANRLGVRVIIPLVDQWKWWGGVAEYAGWRSKP